MNDVRDFGAVGDGTADDTNAIQHAIEMGEGVLHFPKGTYRLTRTIVFDLGKTGFAGLQGEGGTARIRMDGAGPAFRIVGSHGGTAQPSTVEEAVWNSQRFPAVSGIEILGGTKESDGIELVGTMQTTVRNVLIRKCRFGIHLVDRNRNFLLSDSHIYDGHDTGVFFDNCNLHQVVISGNHISYCKRAGIRQFGGDVHNVQITGNDIEYNSGFGQVSAEILLETLTAQTSEFTIASNTLQATREAPGANVLIVGPVESPPVHAKLIAITGNVIGSRDRNVVVENASRVSISGNTIYDGVVRNLILKNCKNFVVSSNTICTRPVSWKSLAVDGVTFDACSNGAVQGNVLNDCGAGQDEPGGALVVKQCDGLNVSNNQIGNPHVSGICVIDSQRCLIQGNSVIRAPDRPIRDDVLIGVLSRNCIVQHNAVW